MHNRVQRNEILETPQNHGCKLHKLSLVMHFQSVLDGGAGNQGFQNVISHPKRFQQEMRFEINVHAHMI